MPRVLLIGLVVLTAACGEKTFESLCASQVPPPAACMTDCNPAPGAATSCPGGFHCAPSGKCDTQCTAGGGQCGDAYSCNSDGYCVSNPGGGSGGDDEPQIDADCPAVDVAATKTTPSIQLLIDRSGSMLHDFADRERVLNDPDNPPGPEKWQTLVDALVSADGVVTQLADKVYLGASMFPTDACPAILESPRALDNKPTIQTLLNNNRPTLDQRNDHVIFTPTPPAIDAVVADFVDHARDRPQNSPPVILLATDGLPNDCTNSEHTEDKSVAAATAAFNARIKLYVLQVGTVAGASQHMQDMANAGLGVKPGQTNAKVFFGTSPTALATALGDIIGGALSCDLTLNKQINPANAHLGDVQLNGEHLTYGTEWTVANDNITLRLLGAVCDRVKNSADAKITASFPCGIIIQ